MTSHHSFSSQSPVLIFGERATASLIGKQLQLYGFHPILLIDWKEGFSFLTDCSPPAIEILRRCLIQFAEFSEGKGIIHPGVTFWAESVLFAQLVREAGLQFIGCSESLLSQTENRLSFFTTLNSLHIPHLVRKLTPLTSLEELEVFCESPEGFFPLFLKSAFHSSALSRLRIQNAAELKKLVPPWLVQLKNRYGEALFFVENALPNHRTALAPFVRFENGQSMIFPVIDASLYFCFRKLIEVGPIHFELSPEIHFRLVGWIQRYINEVNFVGLGVFEFLIEENQIFLVDFYPRLNTDFHLWEKICGTQAIGWQLACFQFLKSSEMPFILPQSAWTMGLGFRIYSENPYLKLPYTGIIQEIAEPRLFGLGSSESIEVYWNYKEKEEIQTSDSGCIAQVFVFGTSRRRLFELATQSLEQFWIAGTIQTNEHFLQQILTHPWMIEGIYESGCLDQDFIPSITPPASFEELLSSVYYILKKGEFYHRLLQESEDFNISEKFTQLSHKVIWNFIENRTLSAPPSPLHWIDGPKHWRLYASYALSGVIQDKKRGVERIYAMPLGNTLMGTWMFRIGSYFCTVRELEEFPRIPAPEKTIPLRALCSGKVLSLFFKEKMHVRASENLFFFECFGQVFPYAISKPVEIIDWMITEGSSLQVGQILGYVRPLPERTPLSVLSSTP